ncbi:MAG: hypothetical protein WBD40_10830, partial [Tepidisphaeraceae bacterium]
MMTRRNRLSNFAFLAAIAVSLVFSLAQTSPRTIQVGPSREVKTIDAALARAAPGDTIELDRGQAFPTKGLK